MTRKESDRGGRELRSGLRHLGKHRPDLAVRELRAAADACPASAAGALELRLYWLAIALLRLDRPELALKSLASAQKLRPRGLARSAYLRRANEYGMPRRPSPDLDDFYAFYSIQIGAYFSRKGRSCFDDGAEKDTVVRLVADAWRSIAKARLRGLDVAAKLALFRGKRVEYPSFGLSVTAIRSVVAVDFRRKAPLRGNERCPCGSGLPYRQCCGRTAGLGEFFCE
jgi:hypothetical protein